MSGEWEVTLNDDDGTAKVIGTVIVDARTLPAKTDGAVARAAIDCGRVTATWFRPECSCPTIMKRGSGSSAIRFDSSSGLMKKWSYSRFAMVQIFLIDPS